MQNTERKPGIQDNYKQIEQIKTATPGDIKTDITVAVTGLNSKGFKEAGVTEEGFKVTCGEVIVFTGTEIDGKYEIGAMACAGDKLIAEAAKFLIKKLQHASPIGFMSVLMDLMRNAGSPSVVKEPQEEPEVQTAVKTAIH